MLSLSLGPVALPIAPVLLLGSVWLAASLASRTAAASGAARVEGSAEAAANALWLAAAWGLLAARVAYLVLHADAYWASPWAVLDVRDGGWHTASGALAGAAWLLWRASRVPALRKALAVGAGAGVAVWLVGSLATGAGEKRPLPPMTLTDVNSGQAIDITQAAQGRPVVVNLWASWCGPCRQEMPLLAAAQQRERQIAVLFVNQGESASTVRAYLVEQGLPLSQVLLDAGARLGPAIGSKGLPTTLFYDAQGRQVDAHFGVLNAPALESRLKALRPAP